MVIRIPDHLTTTYCRSCASITKQRELWGKRVRTGEEDPPRSWKMYHSIECAGCNAISFVVRTWVHPDSMIGDACVEQEDFYPAAQFQLRPQWIGELPESIQPILLESYAAADQHLFTVSAMGIRTVADMVLTECVGDIGGFAQKLDKAIEMGLVSEMSREPLAAIIDAGHASSHRGHIQDENSFALLVSIMEHLLNKIFVAAKQDQAILQKAQELRSSTPPRK